ncbi:MAG TPA: AI-2E family transporter [Flavobacteriales bacterium]|nr:AI-2E family transporter [Flavobacteriales bacterium]
MPFAPGTDTLQRYVYTMAALVLTVVVLFYGRDLILQLVVAGLLAFLLLPLARSTEKRLPRWAGALIGTLTLVLVVLGLFFVIGWQLSSFGKELPVLQQRFAEKGEGILAWLQDQTDMDRREQMAWFNEHVSGLANWGGQAAMKLFSGTGSALAAIAPIPIYVFLFLLLKDRFRIFFTRLGSTREGAVLDVMVRISALSRKYVRGVLTVALIFGSLCALGFALIGLKYALLLGFLLAILNVIPYVGALLGSLLPVFVALVTKDNYTAAIAALAVVLVVQALDNNLITPKVVGSSVSINPLASLVALVGFGMLWGVAGMLLAIPITGMLKVVCDSVPSLEPWGYLLGEEIETPKEKRFHLRFKRKAVEPRP